MGNTARKVAVEDDVDEVLEIAPGRGIVRDPAKEVVPANDAAASGVGEKVGSEQWAVMCPYWMDGIHNFRGIALVQELNASIERMGIGDDRDKVQLYLDEHEEAKKFQLGVVRRSRLQESELWQQNPSEPAKLLGGLFVRDKEGQYRPGEGGRVVLADKGDSLVLKGKSREGYEAAIELALAKGWSSIELKGKPEMMADIWLEARLKGVNVVNYEPSREDKERFAKRLAQMKAAERAAMQEPEQVEVRPYLGEDGLTHTASITYTVSHEVDGEIEEEKFDNAQDAAALFQGLPAGSRPSVLRSVVRAGGEVSAEIIAVSDLGPDGAVKEVKPGTAVDREFNEAFENLVAQEKESQKVAVVSEGQHCGVVLDVKDGIVTQSAGRGQVVYHDVANLSRVPEKGKLEYIKYRDGKGVVVDKEQAKGGREVGR